MEEEKRPKRPRIGAIPGASSQGNNTTEGRYEKVNYTNRPTPESNEYERTNARPYNSYSTQGYTNRYQSNRTSPEPNDSDIVENLSGDSRIRYPQHSGSYQPRQYNSAQQGSYRQTGYNTNRQGGHQRQGGYNNQGNGYQRQGGYNNQGNGYQRQGGYNNQGNGYQRQGGYNNQGNGYQRQGGYNNQGNGYQRQGGYNNQGNGYQRQGGYNPNRMGGYQNGNPNWQGNSQSNYGSNNQIRQNQSQQKRRKIKMSRLPKPVNYVFTDIDPTEEIRLNKYLANAGTCSRREADELISGGNVKVNGQTVTELGTKITRDDLVEIDDKVVTPERKIYILLNKPKNVITTSDDPKGRKTVLDIVKGAAMERVYPVGRLDRNTTGVLLLTNDGDLASKLTHPRFVKKKIYHVWTDKDISEDDMQRIADGVELEDGEIHADAISYVSDTDKKQAGIEIHSGRNRVVRRLFKHLGYNVEKLDRVYFAGLTKKNLPRGKWRHLTQEEVNFLRMGAFE